MTSRTADYQYNIENISSYELCSLDDSQIHQFANKWLKDDYSAENFIKAIRESPFYDTAIRPLTIAHLCAIYERVGKIPDKPKTVYRKIINLLLEEWDEQRNIRRESNYSNFEIDRKFEFLSALAYILTVSKRNVIFTNLELEEAYSKIYRDFDLEKKEASQVVKEIESHSGLLIQEGYFSYEFAHKSLHEFLTAEYLVKLPTIPESRSLLIRLPYELAIAVSISSSPSAYFVELVSKRFVPLKFNVKFLEAFLNRLIIEKPDFNQSDNVGVASLSLYSLYIKSIIEDESQLRIFYPDSLLRQFEGVIDLIFKRNPKDFIFNKYEKFNEYDGDSGHKIYYLKRKDDKDKNIPDYLYCRETFVK